LDTTQGTAGRRSTPRRLGQWLALLLSVDPTAGSWEEKGMLRQAVVASRESVHVGCSLPAERSGCCRRLPRPKPTFKSRHTLNLALLVYQVGLLLGLLFPSFSLGFLMNFMVLRSIWLKILRFAYDSHCRTLERLVGCASPAWVKSAAGLHVLAGRASEEVVVL